MGHSTASGRSSAPQQRVITEAERAAMTDDARSKISGIKAGKRHQSVTFERPDDGHKIRAEVEFVHHTDYWGKRNGYTSYTYRIYDDTTDERLFYTYGREKLADVKDDIYRHGHITPRRGRRSR